VVVRRIELERSTSRNDSGVGAVHDIAQNDRARLRIGEQRVVVGDVPFDMPTRRQVLSWVRGGTEIEVHEPHVHDGGSVKLPTGSHAEVCREDHFLPRSGTTGRRRVLVRGNVEIDTAIRRTATRCRVSTSAGIPVDRPSRCSRTRSENFCVVPILVKKQSIAVIVRFFSSEE
jgi:hypothetical protein